MNAWIIEMSRSHESDSAYDLIWYETADGRNRVVMRNGKLAHYSDETAAKEAISSLGMEYADTTRYDMEQLGFWLCTHENSLIMKHGASPTEVDCTFLLDFWNLFSDIAETVGTELEPVLTRRSRRCYNKLFFGLNIPAITPGNRAYRPAFTHRELRYIRNVLQRGLEIMVQYLD